jgi:hypothetical protein
VRVEEGCHCFIPVDRAVHVLRAFTKSLSFEEETSVAHFLEEHCQFISVDGTITGTEGYRILVKNCLKLFFGAENETAADIEDWRDLTDAYHHVEGQHFKPPVVIPPTNITNQPSITTAAGGDNGTHTNTNLDTATITTTSADGTNANSITTTGEETSSKTITDVENDVTTANATDSRAVESNSISKANTPPVDAHSISHKTAADSTSVASTTGAETTAPKLHFTLPNEAKQHTIIIDMHIVLMIIAEIAHRKLLQVEDQLRERFCRGDVNHDNVLSFEEFSAIVSEVEANLPDRQVLRMFREALIQGTVN